MFLVYAYRCKKRHCAKAWNCYTALVMAFEHRRGWHPEDWPPEEDDVPVDEQIRDLGRDLAYQPDQTDATSQPGTGILLPFRPPDEAVGPNEDN